MSKLTVKKIEALALPGFYNDSPTLYLRVAPGGSKQWVQRVTIDGRRRDIGLGGWPVVTLAKARKRAFENRIAIEDGGDPLAERRKERMPTFRVAAEKAFAGIAPTLRSEKGRKMWWAQLERHAMPKLGDMPVDRIGKEDLLRVLLPIWTSKPEAARKVRSHIFKVLEFAESRDWIQRNLAGEPISGALPPQPAVKEHHRALPYNDVGDALDLIEASKSSAAVKAALRFTILTASRHGEVRLATWSEIDLEARRWTVPKERMKARKEHRVPLSDASLEVIERMGPPGDPSVPVFPSRVKRSQMRPLTDMAFKKLLISTGLWDRATVHGFRSSFRDWCAETGKDDTLAEFSIAHIKKGTEAAYYRTDVFERRRVLMQQWADFVTGTESKVIRLRA